MGHKGGEVLKKIIQWLIAVLIGYDRLERLAQVITAEAAEGGETY